MEHPLSKHPLTGSDDFSEEGLVNKLTRSTSSKGEKSPGKVTRKKPLEFDGDDKLERAVRGSTRLVSEETDANIGNKFVEVSHSSSRRLSLRSKSGAGIDDPLRVASAEKQSEASEADENEKPPGHGENFSVPTVDATFDFNKPILVHTREDINVLLPEGETVSSSGIYVIVSRKQTRPAATGTGKEGSPAAVGEHRERQARRSIADFVWLETRLRARYEGVLVPFLPNMMDVLGRLRFGPSYNEVRRLGLQRFLRQVASHPNLGDTEEVRAFLGHSGPSQWQTVRSESIWSPGDSAIATSLGIHSEEGGLQRLFKWIGYRFWQLGRRVDEGLDYVLKKGREEDSVARDVTAQSLEQLKESFEGLGEALAVLYKELSRHVEARHRERTDALRLQSAVRRLSLNENGRSASLLESIAQAIGPGGDEHLLQTLEARVPISPAETMLLEVLKEYVHMFENVKRILNRRFVEREAYEHAVSTFSNLRSRLERERVEPWEGQSKGPGGERERELREAANTAAADLTEVRKHYQEVINVTYHELQRYRYSLTEILTASFCALAEERAKHHRDRAAAWEFVLAEIHNHSEDSLSASRSTVDKLSKALDGVGEEAFEDNL